MAPAKTVAIKSPRKLIEVALPLDKINVAASREKSIRHGHPSTLHLWWARRPLAAARAVLFGQLVNDPGFERHLNRGINKVDAAKERERLFQIIEDLVVWENTNDASVISAARAEIWKSWRETCELNRNHPDAATLFDPDALPAFHDPFAGGGAIPLEAQRLGLEVYASDLNPVSITINKAMIEIPPLFRGQVPVGPLPSLERDASLSRSDWPATSGLAEDVRRYGIWIRAEANKRIGNLYPDFTVTSDTAQDRPDLVPLIGRSLKVIVWLWARTVKSPNPAYSHVDVPLVSTFELSTRLGKEAYIEPIIRGDQYEFTVKMGKPPVSATEGTKLARGANFKCLLSGSPIEPTYIKAEGVAGRIGQRLMAIVADGDRTRVYLPPDVLQESTALDVAESWKPSTPLPNDPRNFWTLSYGLTTFGDLFTGRQLIALNTLGDLVVEASELCHKDAVKAGLSDDSVALDEGGTGALSYSQAISICLGLVLSRTTNTINSLAVWSKSREQSVNLFSRQAIPMAWDFPEVNPFGEAAGDFGLTATSFGKTLANIANSTPAHVIQADAQTQHISTNKIVSTDPPYYSNVNYADLSDFFYVWLRRTLNHTLPSLYSTISSPKGEELIAAPYRHGGVSEAEAFFLEGMTAAMHNIAEQAHPAFPVTIYYAFKQSETGLDESTSSAGWVTFLGAVLEAGFSISGTWPMRTERPTGVKSNSNSLASSVILVCRKREATAVTVSRREFLRELSAILPDALIDMTRGGVNSPVAPVDLSQAIIGPGMGIFSKYKAVLEADGKPMSVRTALQLINRFLADDEFDGETQFCIQWLESYGWKAADYGSADTLAQAKGAVLAHMNREGLLTSGGGAVQLVRWQELNADWIPERQNLTPIWQALHQLIANLQTHGEQSTGVLLAAMPAVSGRVRTLAYRLYTLAERKGLAEDARPYNELIGAWSAIELAAAEVGPIETQAELF
jgi:putative DNA methylase